MWSHFVSIQSNITNIRQFRISWNHLDGICYLIRLFTRFAHCDWHLSIEAQAQNYQISFSTSSFQLLHGLSFLLFPVGFQFSIFFGILNSEILWKSMYCINYLVIILSIISWIYLSFFFINPFLWPLMLFLFSL